MKVVTAALGCLFSFLTVACQREVPKMTQSSSSKPCDADLRKKLTARQYDVVCNSGTEPPFDNAYWDNHEEGLYVDIVSGEPLFSSKDKFDSGTGWPSFSKPAVAENVLNKEDRTHGMLRMEVRSKGGDSHLGHVFPDGPGPSGLRFCINSASLRFIPVAKLEEEGYGQFLAGFGKAPTGQTQTKETATLAGGCFWGMEELLREIPGVLSTRVGYTGGALDQPTYNDVKKGSTGHAETVDVVFDPKKLSFEDLLEKWFFKMHDPTTANRQGNDVGTQYRSAIFVHSDAQRETAEKVKARVNASGKWKAPVVTEIVKAGKFFDAEEYHQKYLVKNPGGYTCHWMRE